MEGGGGSTGDVTTLSIRYNLCSDFDWLVNRYRISNAFFKNSASL